MMYNRWICISLNKWAEDNPDVNPFENCAQISQLGGADLYWQELLYRYGERTVYNPDRFVGALERLFEYNRYKYKRLLDTTTAVYPVFDNYKLAKSGTETTTHNTSKAKTGTDTHTLNLSDARTDNLNENVTETPRVETTETNTPNVKTKETVTPTVKEIETVKPTVKTKETSTPGVSTTTSITPESYVDETSRTTFDSLNYNAVQKTSHTASTAGSTTVTPTGHDEKITEVVSGDTETTREQKSGTIVTELERISGEDTKVTSKTGTDTTVKTNTGTQTTLKTGTDTMGYNSTDTHTGTDSLGFSDRTDSGYMYREPQNAIKDERSVAYFAILNVILEDVERVTLLSVY